MHKLEILKEERRFQEIPIKEIVSKGSYLLISDSAGRVQKFSKSERFGYLSHVRFAAIIGRPNVGKSTIFNILTGSKSAIVADPSGITRDRKYGNLKDSPISLIDTGGLNEESDDISFIIKEQTDLAIQEADVILFVVDAIDGLLPLDKEYLFH